MNYGPTIMYVLRFCNEQRRAEIKYRRGKRDALRDSMGKRAFVDSVSSV